MEVKGGSSGLGARNVVHVPEFTGKRIRAEQGSDVYFVDIVLNMSKMKGTEMEEMGFDLIKALDDGKVNYLYFRQDFSDIGSLLDPKFEQFDISEAAKYLKE